MKTVTLPLEEYDELLQDQKDKQRLIEELEADAKERGFIVQEVTHVWYNPWSICYKNIAEKSKVKIISRDEGWTRLRRSWSDWSSCQRNKLGS